ncbi:Trm112p-like protein [Syntrophus gentianae]|uniref:Trm112p-like protein n=1 Tax=Syntrophus gentianae TaxID=43775 RepID=A0A1H7UBF3_9BACT|nr:methyltransferase domain-containing protein [Syntrophus gentianae]SEL94382.1 Trm112p-like protein [Syntrophus gentianae]
MKKKLLELIICPHCLPSEYPLAADILQESDGDIETGALKCPHCDALFPITQGVALLDSFGTAAQKATNKYETDEVVSSYLWSHYGELLDDEHASQAYSTWAGLMQPQEGIALDAGGAVGRFAFELTDCCDFVVGIDTSHAFIQVARRLMRERFLVTPLKDEGLLTREVTIRLPEAWRSDKVEFVVANALALPFRKKTFSLFASLNLVDKVPSPIGHLREMNRVTRNSNAQFLLSDPFSWSTDVAPVEEWLGGKEEGRYGGKGLVNIAALLSDGQGELAPSWRVNEPGEVWWKIRTHSNHYELIRSRYLHACR